MRTLRKAFYLRLALSNIRRNRVTYLPYLIATAIMSGVFLLISGLLMTDTLHNVPAGDSAQMIFAFGMVVFALFTCLFMLYINDFLIKRRNREFGLYGVLGLDKRHVGRVLLWENLFVIGGGVLMGAVIALVFGRLLFLVLIRMIRVDVAGGAFSLPLNAYAVTAALFAFIFAFTSVRNLVRVHMSDPIALMSCQKRGEKDKKGIVPLAILGGALLLAAYWFAFTIETPGVALGVFFPLAILVIIATYLLFLCGSIAVLRLLSGNKPFYYRPNSFVTVSGMFHRMRQNARGLATICILSTMLVVTVSGTLSLYLGREQMTKGMYPYDVCVYLPKDTNAAQALAYEQTLLSLADAQGVSLSADPKKLVRDASLPEMLRHNNFVYEHSEFIGLKKLICFDDRIRFDAAGAEADCLAFISAIRARYGESFETKPNLLVSDVFTARLDGYGVYGGLPFLGAFFAALFLAVAVLILYFKQITEGYEDKERFSILQQVGMDDRQVKRTIDRQVLWVFFLPLGATVLHMLFASRIIARMLKTFMLYDWGLVLRCTGGTLAVFALLYFGAYRLTARTYYGIVKR